MTKESEYQLKCFRRKKEKAILLLGGKCKECGYNKCMGALDFHHTGQKEINISEALTQWNWNRLEKELSKCILLCANCHREHHYRKVDDYKLVRSLRPLLKKECAFCGKEIITKIPTKKYCGTKCQYSALSMKYTLLREFKAPVAQLD